jgi:hypothetical protein
LTQFAVILSAIIHDLDHQGVPNVQLVNEKAKVAEQYKNVSVAEQNRYVCKTKSLSCFFLSNDKITYIL